MPADCCGEECHKDLRPEVFVYNSEDAVTDSKTDQTDGIDFDLERYCAVTLEVLDILTKDAVVDKPIIESIRRAYPERCSEQQKWRCRQKWQKDSCHSKSKRDGSEYNQYYFHATTVLN